MQDSQPTNILAIQSYGDPSAQNPGGAGSRARVDHAVELVEKGVIPTRRLIALFPQGYSAKSPIKQRHPHDLYLGFKMRDYLRLKLGGIQAHCAPMGWGTEADITNTVIMTQRLGCRDVHIHFVSDPSHIQRVALICAYVCPPDWMTSFYAATRHRMSWRERLVREPGARLVTRYKYWRRGERFWISTRTT